MSEIFLRNCLITTAVMFFSLTIITSLAQVPEASGHHIQFGTRSQNQSSSGSGDSGLFLAESPTGKIIVAGYAEGSRSDTGGTPPKPMLAAFSRNGSLLWQRVYDRTGWEIIALNAKQPTIRIVLWHKKQFKSNFRKNYNNTPDNGRVELWSVNKNGELDRLLLGIDHDSLLPVIHTTADTFTLWKNSLNYSAKPEHQHIRIQTYDWSGNAFADSTEFLTSIFSTLTVDRHGGLYMRMDANEHSRREYLVYVDRKGHTVESPLVPDCGPCIFMDARRNNNAFEVLAASDDTRGSWRGLRLLNFDTAQETVKVVREYPALDGARVVFNDLPDGGFLLTGEDKLAPLIAKLSKDRELLWVKRFKSDMRYSTLTRAIELDDGDIAMTGRTAPYRPKFSEPDSDAILLFSDADGNYLNQFGKCIVTDGSLAAAQFSVARRYGAIFSLYDLDKIATHKRKSDSNTLPENVLPIEHCEDTSEIRLLDFLNALLAYKDIHKNPAHPDVAYLRLKPQNSDRMGSKAFAYRPSHSASRMVPQISVDLSRGRDIAKELTENVVPYLNDITTRHLWMYKKIGFFFENGDNDALSRYPITQFQEFPLTPAKIARTTGILETSFNILSDAEKATLQRYAGSFTRVTIFDAPGDIREDQYWNMYLPAARAEQFWQWTLDKIRPHEERIRVLESELKQRLGITVSGRPPVKPDQFRDFLEQLVHELESVPKRNMNITMEYTTDRDDLHRLYLWQGNNLLGSSVTDISAQQLATWLESILL